MNGHDVTLVDLHCHILPGVDDGASNDAEALRMLDIAEADGIGLIAATPHAHHCPAEKIAPGVARLNTLAADAGLMIRVVPGSENRLTAGLTARHRAGQLVTLNATPYLLIELPFDSGPWLPLFHQVASDLQAAGLWPILAHAERYGEIQRDPEQLRSLIAAGIPIQINAGSLTGSSERSARPAVEYLVRHRMAHLLASDGHGAHWQPPQLRAALTRVAELADKDQATWMARAAAAVIHGEALALPAPLQVGVD